MRGIYSYINADDVQLYRGTCIEDIRLCIDSINDDLRIIDNWANTNGCVCRLMMRNTLSFIVRDGDRKEGILRL